MANAIIRHIPNTVTCLNLFSGCIACVMAFEAKYELAVTFIILSAVFDFFDGMLARLLHAYSPIGKELDSLADDVSFGVAPAILVFSFMKEPRTCVSRLSGRRKRSIFLIWLFLFRYSQLSVWPTLM